MGMKPIASRNEEWAITPVSIMRRTDGNDGYVLSASNGDEFGMTLPDGLTFAQFLDQYNRCTDAIYFID